QLGTVNLQTLAITQQPLAATGAAPVGMASGPDGNLWFTESGAASLGAVLLAPSAVTTPTPTGVGSGVQDPTSAPSSSIAARVVVGGQVLIVGKGRHRHVAGYRLAFNEPLDAAAAQDPANYAVLVREVRDRAQVARPVTFRADYDPATDSVELLLRSRPR